MYTQSLKKHRYPDRKAEGEWILLSSVVSLKLLYNDNKGCHSRENGNPAEKTGFRIKSGMTFCVKSFLRQYTSRFNWGAVML